MSPRTHISAVLAAVKERMRRSRKSNIGEGTRSSHQAKSGKQAMRDGKQRKGLRRGPAPGGRLNQRQDQAEEPDRRDCDAHHVDAGAGA